ncbi:hypothetical protein GGQ97_002748 [Sphingomonas kaistensis]|uniref:M50 family peptidase n=1 Tax=Sphingomonas kaistensis TaxID=298708 RepID=A0A7X5YAQ5_9SPHN|nr:hypothetical protein [Sphingomonas kaistensis]NJC06955.1 hypothetical protein [Sphingomonas kaistensis]
MASSRAGRLAILPTAVTGFAVVMVMNLLHEAGHALAGKAMGYDVIVRTNHATVASGRFDSVADGLTMAAAGPLVTIAIALVACLTARRGSILAAGIVLAALASRLIAAAASLNYPNDEARISIALGLGKWTLFGAVISLLALLTAFALRGKRLGWRCYLGAYIGASVGTALVVLGEPWLPVLRF